MATTTSQTEIMPQYQSLDSRERGKLRLVLGLSPDGRGGSSRMAGEVLPRLAGLTQRGLRDGQQGRSNASPCALCSAKGWIRGGKRGKPLGHRAKVQRGRRVHARVWKPQGTVKKA